MSNECPSNYIINAKTFKDLVNYRGFLLDRDLDHNQVTIKNLNDAEGIKCSSEFELLSKEENHVEF